MTTSRHHRPHDHTRDPIARHDVHEREHGPARRDRGQATTEYALILLAAALVAVLVIGWATAGGGVAAIGRLFDRAIDAAIEQLG